MEQKENRKPRSIFHSIDELSKPKPAKRRVSFSEDNKIVDLSRDDVTPAKRARRDADLLQGQPGGRHPSLRSGSNVTAPMTSAVGGSGMGVGQTFANNAYFANNIVLQTGAYTQQLPPYLLNTFHHQFNSPLLPQNRLPNFPPYMPQFSHLGYVPPPFPPVPPMLPTASPLAHPPQAPVQPQFANPQSSARARAPDVDDDEGDLSVTSGQNREKRSNEQKKKEAEDFYRVLQRTKVRILFLL